MAEINTRGDSLRFYLTGAGSDGGSQASAAASLGNYRSSTRVGSLGIAVANAISNITINHASGPNGEGSGELEAVGADDLAWTPPGGTQGDAVTISNGETKILEGGDTDSQWIEVTRTSATALSGTADLNLSDPANNVFGFDDVSSAEATAGDSEYRCFAAKNTNALSLSNVTFFIEPLEASVVSGTQALGASGAGTIRAVSSSAFADWPRVGLAHIKTSGGSTREIVYYERPAGNDRDLVVPAAGRGLLGTSAAAGATSDIVHPVAPIRIAKEGPAANAQTIANESTAPTGLSWSTAITAATGVNVGTMAAGDIVFIWVHRSILAGHRGTDELMNWIGVSFEV